MLLKVGELAKHTGLTVRTLHHYDEIGRSSDLRGHLELLQHQLAKGDEPDMAA